MSTLDAYGSKTLDLVPGRGRSTSTLAASFPGGPVAPEVWSTLEAQLELYVFQHREQGGLKSDHGIDHLRVDRWPLGFRAAVTAALDQMLDAG